jgi:hypothetical protein
VELPKVKKGNTMKEEMALAFGPRYKKVSYFMFRKEFDCG